MAQARTAGESETPWLSGDRPSRHGVPNLSLLYNGRRARPAGANGEPAESSTARTTAANQTDGGPN